MDRCGTDKIYHGYAEHYELLLSHYRYRPITLLEIGTYKGCSLEAWKEYLPKATIVGFDLVFPRNNPKGVKFFQGNQGITSDLVQCHRTFGPFDIVIDDGSHKTMDHITSFNALYPLLQPNGLYVIEDLNQAVSTMDYFKDHPDAQLIECDPFPDGRQWLLTFHKVPNAA